MFLYKVISVESIMRVAANDSDSQTVAVRVAKITLVPVTQVLDLHPVNKVIRPPAWH